MAQNPKFISLQNKHCYFNCWMRVKLSKTNNQRNEKAKQKRKKIKIPKVIVFSFMFQKRHCNE